MKLPVIRGVIDRRMLVNYRVDPSVLVSLLPHPFRPKLLHGHGMVGICLIRLKHIRPAGLPAWLGIGSENAAHRAAVEWEEDGRVREGVYIWRRHNQLLAQRARRRAHLPGVHEHARFTVREAGDQFDVSLLAGQTQVAVSGRRTADWPRSSLFGSLSEASAFFAAGSLGYSPAADASQVQGLELKCEVWQPECLAVEEVRSSFFEDEEKFPSGTIELDCALLMREVEHEWRRRESLFTSRRVYPGGVFIRRE